MTTNRKELRMSSTKVKIEGNPHERMKELIAKFTLQHSYWGYLFSTIRRKPAKNFGSIMGVSVEPDGSISLLYEPDLVSNTEDKHLSTIITHEGMHVLNKHLPRLLRILSNESDKHKKTLKMGTWNIASDCTVNSQANIREDIIIDGEAWPPQLPKMHDLEENGNTEKYYMTLLERAKKDKSYQKALENMKNHETWLKNLENITDVSSLARKADQFTQGVIKEALKSFNKNRGKLPAGLAELIQEALEQPKAPYYQIIKRLIKGSRLTKIRRSPTRINRKRTYTFMLDDEANLPKISPFPGRSKDVSFNIVTLIDTSGSMDIKSVKEGLSGIKNLIEKDPTCKTTVLEADTVIEKEYSPRKVSDIQFNIKGRGGTVLFPGLERARELGCDVCLVFTDGGCEDINNISRKYLPKKIIWVITEGGTASMVNKTGFVVEI